MIEEGTVQKNKLTSAHRMVGHDSRAAAVYYLVLDECEEATHKFRTAATHYRNVVQLARKKSGSPEENEPVDLRYLLHVALLADDGTVIMNAADLTLGISSAYVKQYSSLYHYYYVAALAAEIQETGDQQTYLDELDEVIEGINPDYVEKKLHVLYRAWWRVLSGIVSRDEQLFDQGMTELLDHHAEFASSNSTNPKDLVCLSGAALVALARRKGMDIRIESEYVPDCVYELA